MTIGVGSFKVAPVVSCLAESQPESTQYQAQALRVAWQSLTPGPVLSGIQALRHATPGGIYQWSGERAGSKSRGPPVDLNCGQFWGQLKDMGIELEVFGETKAGIFRQTAATFEEIVQVLF